MQSTSREILREIAKQGNPAAIATLLNLVFQPHGVRVKVSINGNVLKIVLVSETITDKSTLRFLLMQELRQISDLPCDEIKVHCHKKISCFFKGEYSEKIEYNVWTEQQKINELS